MRASSCGKVKLKVSLSQLIKISAFCLNLDSTSWHWEQLTKEWSLMKSRTKEWFILSNLSIIWKLPLKITFCLSVPKKSTVSQFNLNSQSKMPQVVKKPTMRMYTASNCTTLLLESSCCSKVSTFARHNRISSLWLKINHLHKCSTSRSWNLMGQIWCPCYLSIVDPWLTCLMIRIQNSSLISSQSSTETRSARMVSTMEASTTIFQPLTELWEAIKSKPSSSW